MIRAVINIYILVLIINTILTYLPKYSHLNWVVFIKKISDFTLNPVRKYLPNDLSLDPSPLIVIIILKVIEVLW